MDLEVWLKLVECLLCKSEVLNSNSSPTPRKVYFSLRYGLKNMFYLILAFFLDLSCSSIFDQFYQGLWCA
jgi:hypothetical protein